MLRSMYSGISGMRANQTKLDVSGNNIANVGTTAFKGSRVRFQDMLSQNMSEAIGPGRNQGGVNPKQVGLGVQVAGIDTLMTQGMMQPTGRNLDVGIDGEGYFIVSRGPVPQNNASGVNVDAASHTMSGGDGIQKSFTRDGSFTLDHAGNLLTSDGYRIMGYPINYTDGSGEDSIDYGANGVCNFVDVDSEKGIKAQDSLVPLRVPGSVYVKASNIKDTDHVSMGYTGTGKIDGLATPITQPEISTNGEFKGGQDLRIDVKWVEDATTPTNSKFHVFVNGKDTKKEPGAITVKVKDIADALNLKDPTDPTKTKLDIDKCNSMLGTSNEGDTIVTLTGVGNPPQGDEEKYSWSYTLSASGMKKVTSFSIEKDGILKATLEDGKVSALGQIATASFNNTSGLKKIGKNMYLNTANSGAPNVRSGIGADPATDNSDGFGDLAQGMLEMSNVDLAEQFTDMIVASRAFQASGKMISTGDEILQDIINLKR
ncbi:flagellar hook protein FlgE [Haloimpatiens sp. FM7315]|uniref:flagellar hook protein FlgE n=1 Tax=Haloimpatiens sp. FM7315 TaxID=3298609 RepID=UPI0035A2BB30